MANLVSPTKDMFHFNGNEYLFTVTGVEKMKWFLSLMMCDFQPRVTEGHEIWKESLESFFKVWKDGEKVLEGLVEVFGHDWRRRRRLWR